jgi:hypothetical protein
MSDHSKSYTGFTRQKLDKLKASLRSKGIDPPAGDVGVLRGKGVVIEAKYNEASQTLWLNITEKPFIISYDYVWNLIDQEIRKLQ